MVRKANVDMVAVAVQTAKAAPDGEIGATGLVRGGGEVTEEWHQALRGKTGVRAYREMRDSDSTIGASLHVIDSLVRQVPWRVDRAPEHPQADDAAVLLEQCIGDMSHTWQDFLSEVLSCLPFGWAYFEKVYKQRKGAAADPPSRYDDGAIGFRKLAIRAQETLDSWQFDAQGGIQGMWQCAAPDYKRVFVPIDRAVLFRPSPTKNNPEGRSILRNAYRSWFFLKRLQELEAIGIERDLVGLPVLTLPQSYFDQNAPQPKKQALANYAKLLVQIRRNEHEGVVLPPELDEKGMPTGFKLSLLSSGGTRALDISGAIVRYEQRIAQTLLTQFLFLGMDKVGSLALSSDMTSLFASALGALLDSVEETFHRYCTADLMTLNGYPPEAWPRLKHGDVERQDIRPLAESLVKLVDGGLLTPDSTLEDYLRKEGRLPDREMDEALDGDDGDAPATDEADDRKALTLNYLSLMIQRFAAIGDVEMVNTLRRQVAMEIGVPMPANLTAADLATAAATAE